MRSFRCFLSGALAPALLAAPPAVTSPRPEPTADELFQLGQQLFDQLAPPEIKAQYEFPSKPQWDEFAVRLQKVLEGDDLAALAAYAPQARAALPALRFFPEYADYTDWLTARLDELEAAEQIVAPPAGVRPRDHRCPRRHRRRAPSQLHLKRLPRHSFRTTNFFSLGLAAQPPPLAPPRCCRRCAPRSAPKAFRPSSSGSPKLNPLLTRLRAVPRVLAACINSCPKPLVGSA